jgi:Spy/CpxP family protein refolding chaperone
MRTNLGRTILAAAMAFGLAAAVAAQSQGGQGMRGQGMMGQQGGPGMRQGMGPGGSPMAALNLSPEQRAAIQAIQQNHRAATEKASMRLRDLQQQLRDALFGAHPDDAKGLVAQMAEAEAQLLPARVAMQIDIVKQLTADQKTIAKELNVFGAGGMPGGPGGMRGGRGGQPPVKK